jgi:hypothetical protein
MRPCCYVPAGKGFGCVAEARFRFAQRPEWLHEGARLIVRDRGDGHVAAAGFVTRVLPSA